MTRMGSLSQSLSILTVSVPSDYHFENKSLLYASLTRIYKISIQIRPSGVCVCVCVCVCACVCVCFTCLIALS